MTTDGDTSLAHACIKEGGCFLAGLSPDAQDVYMIGGDLIDTLLGWLGEASQLVATGNGGLALREIAGCQQQLRQLRREKR